MCACESGGVPVVVSCLVLPCVVCVVVVVYSRSSRSKS